MPHRSCIALDRVDGSNSIVVHTVFAKRYILPAGTWELVHHDDQAAASNVSHSAVEPILIDDMFSVQLQTTDDGTNVVEDSTGGSVAVWSLDDKYREMAEITVQTKHGAMHSSHLHRCFKLVFPREGFRYYWSMPTLYAVCRMDSYGGKAGQWAYKLQHSWERALHSYGINAVHLMPSTLCSPDLVGPHARQFGRLPCLPEWSASSFAMIFLVIRWIGQPQRQGGLIKLEQRAAAEEFIVGLFRSCLHKRSLRIMVFPEHWAYRYMFRCITTSQSMFALSVDDSMDVDIRPMIEADLSGDRVCRRWLKTIC